MDSQDSKLTIRTCNCGIPNIGTRIVGGIPTEANEFPWQVSIWHRAQKATKAGKHTSKKNMDEMKIILGMLTCTDSIDTDII